MPTIKQNRSEGGIGTHIYSTLRFILFPLPRGKETLSVKSQIGNILGFVGQTVSNSPGVAESSPRQSAKERGGSVQ